MRRKSILGLVAGIVLVGMLLLFWPRGPITPLPSVAAVALVNAETYELLSLDPSRQPPDELDAPAPPQDGFHGYRILGRVPIADAAIRQALNTSLQDAVGASPAACFDPRHGIRVTRNGEATDLVICFECHRVQVWRGEKLIAHWTTDDAPQPLFDRVLREGGVELAKPAR